MKPPRDLRSKFELKQAAKERAEKEAEEEKRRKEEEDRIAVNICRLHFSYVFNSLINWQNRNNSNLHEYQDR